MKKILFLLAAVVHTTVSQDCFAPNVTRNTSRYYDDGYGWRHYDPCHFNLTVDISCYYSETGKYISPISICPNDYIRLHFYLEEVDVLQGSSFETDFKISELYMDNVCITRIIPGAFNHQYAIQNISMKQNNISVISDGIFTSLAHLEVLDLSENQIMSVSEDAFASLPLKKLNLSKNAIPSIPGSVAGVRILDMSYNRINSVPSKVFSTAMLNVSNNEIRQINLTNFPLIKKLYIASNKIEEINLQGVILHELDLYNNNITVFPDNLDKLELLNLGSNSISKLPNKTIIVENLRELYLNDNGISSIPAAFLRNLKKLEVLDLSKNGLTDFTFGTFDGLQSLKTLNISYNRFKELPLYILHSMKYLKNLYFSHCGLTGIDAEELLKHTPKLEVVDIDGNTLSCYKLLEVVHKLGRHHVSVVHGAYAEGNNIYGMKCTEDDDSVSIKEISSSPGINQAYAALVNYFNKEFRNSNFVQYLENLKNVGNRNEELSVSHNFTDVLKRTMNEIIKTDKKQTDVLEKILDMINQTDAHQMTYTIPESNHTLKSEGLINSLKEVLYNYTKVTDENRYEEFREFFKVLKDKLTVKVQYQPAVTVQVPDKEILEHTSEYQISQQPIHEAAQLISSGGTAIPGNPPVLTFIAVLLTIITILLFVLGYVILTRAKYVVCPNGQSDVELNRLVESKHDDVNN